MKKIYVALLFLISYFIGTSQTYYDLSSGPFLQNWTNVGQITANDNWSGVPSIIGYLGQDITTGTGTDPQTLTSVSTVANDIDVVANQTNTSITNGGVIEFEIANPVVALQGSGTADAPNLIIYLNTTGVSNIIVAYLLRDVDGSTDNAIQPVALQYRIGGTGSFTNIPAGFVADASSGPSLATLTTPVSVTLPAVCNNQVMLELRIISTNAVGNDESIGIDDISVSSPTVVPVKLADIQASRSTGVTLLNWLCAFENAFEKFEVERSLDGRTFTKINDVTGRNAVSYSVNDYEKLPPGKVFYRLKMIDVDGQFSYSRIIPITVEGKYSAGVIFPNPVADRLQIKLYQPLSKGNSVSIIDQKGQRIKSVTFAAGTTLVNIPVADLGTGKYFVMISENGFTDTQSFVIVR